MGVDGQEIVDALAGFQKVDQRLDGNACAGKTRNAVHRLLVDADDRGKRGFLFYRHVFTINEDEPARVMRAPLSIPRPLASADRPGIPAPLRRWSTSI